jgi:hypothetical protein
MGTSVLEEPAVSSCRHEDGYSFFWEMCLSVWTYYLSLFSRKSSDMLLNNVSWNLEWQISKPIHYMSIVLDIVHCLKHFWYTHYFGNWMFPWSGVRWKGSCSIGCLEGASLDHQTVVAFHVYEYCTTFAVGSASLNKQNYLFILHNHHLDLSHKCNETKR